ncbi:MAG TPA: hypothetical protein ENO24_00060, partial [Chloroflexi bacterium]|nr:hypothetical protein [Chloroflexota bacterium]
MKRAVLVGLVVLVVVAGLAAMPSSQQVSAAENGETVPGRILVKFTPGTSPAQKAAIHRVQGGTPLGSVPGIGVEVVSVPERAEEA